MVRMYAMARGGTGPLNPRTRERWMQRRMYYAHRLVIVRMRRAVNYGSPSLRASPSGAEERPPRGKNAITQQPYKHLQAAL